MQLKYHRFFYIAICNATISVKIKNFILLNIDQSIICRKYFKKYYWGNKLSYITNNFFLIISLLDL